MTATQPPIARAPGLQGLGTIRLQLGGAGDRPDDDAVTHRLGFQAGLSRQGNLRWQST